VLKSLTKVLLILKYQNKNGNFLIFQLLLIGVAEGQVIYFRSGMSSSIF